MKRIWEGRLFTKITGIYVLFFFIVIISTIVLSYRYSMSQLEEALLDTNIALLHHIDQKVGQQLDEINRLTLNLATNKDVVWFMESASAAEGAGGGYIEFQSLQSQINQLLHTNPNLYSIYLYSKRNDSVMTESTRSKTQQFFDNGWFVQFQDMKNYFTLVNTRKVKYNSGIIKNMITFVRNYPMISKAQERKGAIVANIDEMKLQKLMKSPEMEGEGAITFVIDAENKIISHPDKNLIFTAVSEHYQNVNLNLDQGQTRWSRGDANSSVYYVASSYTDWVYVRVIEEININSSVKAMRNTFFITAIVMFVLSFVLVMVYNRFAFQPVDRLLNTVSMQLKSFGNNRTVSEKSIDYLEQHFTRVMTDYKDMQKEMRDNRLVLKWRFLMEIVMGFRTNYETEKSYFELFGIHLYPHHYMVFTSEIDQDQENPLSTKDLNLYLYIISNVGEELIQGEARGVSMILNENQCTFIVSFEDQNLEKNQLLGLSLIDLIRQTVKGYLKRTVTIGVGNLYQQMEHIHKSYKESLQSLEYKIIMGGDAVILYENIQISSTLTDYMNVFARLELVFEALQSGHALQSEEHIRVLFAEAFRYNFSPEMFNQLSMQIILQSIKIVSDQGVDVHDVLNSSNNVQTILNQNTGLQQMQKYVTDLIYTLGDRLAEKRNNKGKNQIIEKIDKYIHEHFSDNSLSLNMMAHKYNISMSYLSKIYKEYTGNNFIDELIRVRMEHAKTLLEGSSITINEISEKIGYSNTYSFIRIFKKHTGVTPGEYRDQFLANNDL